MKKIKLGHVAFGLFAMEMFSPIINEILTKERYQRGYEDGFKACLRAHNVMLKELFRKKVS